MSSLIEPIDAPFRPTAVTAPALALRVAAAATLLVLVSFTIVVTTVGAVAATFGAHEAGQTWALSGMSVGLAAALLAAGVLADRFGRRRVLLGAAAALAVTSALAAAAPSMAVFVVARVLQGIAGGGVVAASLGLIGHAFPDGAARTRATGVWGAMVGAGIAAGPVLGAVIASATGWRPVQWAVAAAAALLVVAGRPLEESRARHARALDVPGATAFAVAMAALTGALISGRQGWARPATLVPLAVGLLAMAAFVVIELRRREPLLELRLFRRPAFVASTGGALFTGLALISLMSVLPTFLVRAYGFTPLASAGTLAAWSGMSVVVALLGRRLPERIEARWRLAVGFVLCGAGEAMLSGLGADATWRSIVPGLLVAGVGSGLGNAALGRLAVASVSRERAGMGSGASNTARYLGAAAGVAVVVAIIAAAGGPGTAGLIHGWNVAALVAAGLCLAGAVLAAACRSRDGQRA